MLLNESNQNLLMGFIFELKRFLIGSIYRLKQFK